MHLPDVVAVCLSSPEQAAAAERAIERRRSSGIYPRELTFAVVHDPPGGRVGSGGGTLHALSQLRERFGDAVETQSILLLHAGGESRRLPAYAPEGKLFAPVPVPSSTLLPPVLFDIQLSLYLSYPWRDGELVVGSGDVYLDFGMDSVQRERGAVCGFAAPASFEVGSRHGVFAFDRTGRQVVDYLQKAPVEELSRVAALSGNRSCALDIGIVAFHGEGRRHLRDLGDLLGPRIASGSLYLDLYVEILTASLPGLGPEEYLSRIADKSRLDEPDALSVHAAFHDLGLQGVLVRDSAFLHFGSVAEVPTTAGALVAGSHPVISFYDVAARAGLQHELGPESQGAVVLNDCQSVTVTGEQLLPSYLDRVRHSTLRLSGHNLIVGVTERTLDRRGIPTGICLDERTVNGVVVTACYHRDDTFKPVADSAAIRFLGKPLQEWLTARGLTVSDVGTAIDLWALRLFAEGATDEQLEGYLHDELVTPGWTGWFKTVRRWTLAELNAADSADARESARVALRTELLRESILSGHGWQSLPAADFESAFPEGEDRGALQARVVEERDPLVRIYRGETLRIGTQSSIQVSYLSDLTIPPRLTRAVKSDQIVWARSPVRMDLGGGWSDTPPYTLREGGRVTNVAINLNGQPPVQVFCRPLREAEIRFHSIDHGHGEVVRTFGQLEGYSDPTVPFALARAAFVLLGFSQSLHPGRTLEQVLKDLDGGLELTVLSAVPQGSGLGTSSILAATLLAALQRFFGVYNEQHINTGELYRQVLQLEQMLTTGGGWQDQVGGVAGGIKYSVSTPGIRPELQVYRLDPFLFLDPTSTARYTLFYTGATRLAKNILQEVVAGFNSMSPAYLFTVRRIAALADASREAFALRDMQRLAWVINESWRENKLMHPSTTNDEIEEMLTAARPHYQAQKLLGAGGGGFAFFVSPSAAEAGQLKEVLTDWAAHHNNPRARVVDLSLNQTGLEVSVS